MKHIFDLRSASLVDTEVLKRSTEGASYPLQIAAKPDAFDLHNDASINTALWASIGGGNSEGAFIGVNCIQMTGPAAPAWDTDGVIYKPALTPTVGNAIIGQVILTEGSKFAVGLQEYIFTVDDVVTPTAWTLKYDVAQATDSSTYVLFEPGRISLIKGGSGGSTTVISDSSWMVSDAATVRPIYVAFVFSNNGYQVYVNQPMVWDAPRLIGTIVRSAGTHPVNGYSFCVDKYYSDSTLGFYGLCQAFKTAGTVSNYLIVDSTSKVLQLNTLELNEQVGGIISQSGSVYVQFPTISPKWYTLTEVAGETTQFTGEYAYPINFKLSGDATISHPIQITDTTT